MAFRCPKGHEYTGEPLPFAVGAKGTFQTAVFVCPYCLLQLVQRECITFPKAP